MSELAGRLDEVSAAAIQQEVARVVALGVGSVLAVEEEEPSERHAGPCAIRYNNDTQFDISTITSSFCTKHSTSSCTEACNGTAKNEDESWSVCRFEDGEPAIVARPDVDQTLMPEN